MIGEDALHRAHVDDGNLARDRPYGPLDLRLKAVGCLAARDHETRREIERDGVLRVGEVDLGRDILGEVPLPRVGGDTDDRSPARRRIASTRVTMMTTAPMPRPRVATEATVNAGARSRRRTPMRRS
jgi:hypothetical protein